MKTALLALALVTTLPAARTPAYACDSNRDGFELSCCDPPVRWAARQDPRDARISINSADNEVSLVLTSDIVALQLSDRVMHKIQRKLHAEERDSDDNALGRTIKLAVLSSVHAVLDHSAEVSIDDVRDVEYRNGRLRITTENGKRLFERTNVDHRSVLSAFSESDARAFVREFRRMKAARRD
jgi:hypothetical protein